MTRGKPLGISARASNSDRCLDFPADALIFLYSDGLLEARGHVGLMFEMDGLSAQLADRSPNPGADNLSGLPAKFQVRTALSLHDDLIPPLVAPLISKSSGAPPGGLPMEQGRRRSSAPPRPISAQKCPPCDLLTW